MNEFEPEPEPELELPAWRRRRDVKYLASARGSVA